MYVVRKPSETATEKLPDLLKHGIHALQRGARRGRTDSVKLRADWPLHLESDATSIVLYSYPRAMARDEPILHFLAESEEPADEHQMVRLAA